MPFKVTRTKISDINPNSIGGIIKTDNGEVIFQYNIVSNVLSSTSAACFYITNSKINIENSCFTRCTAKGGQSHFGNIGRIISTKVKISHFSSFQCPFSTSYCGDSLFRFESCGASIKHFNSSFNFGVEGSPVFRTDNNISSYEVKFVTCSSCIDWAFLECYHVICYEKCSFINSTLVTNYMICASQGSIFDTCYFFQMTTSKPKFQNSVILKNCCSDETITNYQMTVYSNINVANFPILNKPLCKGEIICSCKKSSRNHANHAFLIIFTMIS